MNTRLYIYQPHHERESKIKKLDARVGEEPIVHGRELLRRCAAAAPGCGARGLELLLLLLLLLRARPPSWCWIFKVLEKLAHPAGCVEPYGLIVILGVGDLPWSPCFVSVLLSRGTKGTKHLFETISCNFVRNLRKQTARGSGYKRARGMQQDFARRL